ncbi:type II secretory system protein G [Candidatus Scalindua japonica]|uniref:Type II secretory system protein G n=1 Tax=Candidatus Scalindua japonica TaxID=1284222 RepID=A0A286TTN0_9BACT|nr:type II secretion system protein [Candidatus Scalindua japonica]GAX59223.1 type II secretory system protein G [Candidatus Scalindua japonica]
MSLKKQFNQIEKLKASFGFTLVEVIFSVVILGLISAGVAYPYMIGMKSINAKEDRMLLDSALRSRMEILISTDFGALSDSSEVVNINGQNYTITWTVVNMDMDGDAVPETNAKLVVVSVTEVPGRSLTTIIVDNEGRIGKIS